MYIRQGKAILKLNDLGEVISQEIYPSILKAKAEQRRRRLTAQAEQYPLPRAQGTVETRALIDSEGASPTEHLRAQLDNWITG